MALKTQVRVTRTKLADPSRAVKAETTLLNGAVAEEYGGNETIAVFRLLSALREMQSLPMSHNDVYVVRQ